MSYIDGTEIKPDKSLYYNIITNKEGEWSYSDAKSLELVVRYADRSSEFNRNNKRALGALKSIIS